MSQTIYTSKNLPKDKQTASSRIAELENDILKIEQNIASRSSDSFSFENEYYAWKHRAEDAKKFKQNEIDFLRAWLIHGDEAATKYKFVVNRPSDIRNKARVLADQLNMLYTPRYTADNLPLDVIEAKNRQEELTQIKREHIEPAFSHISELCQRLHIPEKQVSSFKKALQPILKNVDAEFVIIREYLRQMGTQKSWWATDLLAILDRIKTEDFELAEKEIETIELFREYVQSRN